MKSLVCNSLMVNFSIGSVINIVWAMVMATSTEEISDWAVFAGGVFVRKGCIVFLVNDEAVVLKSYDTKNWNITHSTVAGIRE